MLGVNILGTVETVEAVTPESLREHMRKFYVPERMVISLSGNFCEEKAVEICKSYFEDMKNTGFGIETVKAEYIPCRRLIKKDFMQNQIILGFPGIALTDKRRHAVMLMSSILGSASSSRLFQRLREELGLVYSVDSVGVSHMDTGIFMICMGLSEKSELKAINETLKIVREFSQTVTERELARAKEQTVANFVMSLESISSIASRNARGVLLFDKIVSEEETIKKYRSVTLEELRSVAKEILDVSNISLCAVGKVKSNKKYSDEIR